MSSVHHQKFKFKNQTLRLLPQKAMFWEETELLVVSDVHFGKSGHFRKYGIAVPDTVNQSNITKLDALIAETSPKTLLFLGDLFHSESNNEVKNFSDWRNTHSGTEMLLTIGNHDILTRYDYDDMKLNCVEKFTMGPFIFAHDRDSLNHLTDNHYPITGHVHPAVKITGKGRQSIYAPCFYFGTDFGMLPAFGSFTGSHRIKPSQNEYVFPVVEEKVLDISQIFSQD